MRDFISSLINFEERDGKFNVQFQYDLAKHTGVVVGEFLADAIRQECGRILFEDEALQKRIKELAIQHLLSLAEKGNATK